MMPLFDIMLNTNSSIDAPAKSAVVIAGGNINLGIVSQPEVILYRRRINSSFDNEVDPERLRIAEDELRPLFKSVNLSHPAMAELFRLCLQKKMLNEPH